MPLHQEAAYMRSRYPTPRNVCLKAPKGTVAFQVNEDRTCLLSEVFLIFGKEQFTMHADIMILI